MASIPSVLPENKYTFDQCKEELQSDRFAPFTDDHFFHKGGPHGDQHHGPDGGHFDGEYHHHHEGGHHDGDWHHEGEGGHHGDWNHQGEGGPHHGDWHHEGGPHNGDWHHDGGWHERDGHLHHPAMCTFSIFLEKTSSNLLPPDDAKDVNGLIDCAQLPENNNNMEKVAIDFGRRKLSSSKIMIEFGWRAHFRYDINFEWSDPCVALETRCYDVTQFDTSQRDTLQNILQLSQQPISRDAIQYLSVDCTNALIGATTEQIQDNSMPATYVPREYVSMTENNNKHSSSALAVPLFWGILVVILFVGARIVIRKKYGSVWKMLGREQIYYASASTTDGYELQETNASTAVPVAVATPV